MSEPSPPTPREQNRLAVSRLTKLLAGAAVAATAAFGVVVASEAKHGSTTSTDSSSVSDSGAASSYTDDGSYSDDGYSDDGFGGLAPSQGVWSTGQSPTATSGGS